MHKYLNQPFEHNTPWGPPTEAVIYLNLRTQHQVGDNQLFELYNLVTKESVGRKRWP